MKKTELKAETEKIFFKIWPFIFLFIVWFIFASLFFLKGLVPYSSTYQVNHFAPWDAYQKFWGPVKNGAMPDVTSQIYPWRHLVIELWQKGIVPLWNPYSFSGTPLLANYQSAVFQPLNLFFFALSFIDAWSILVLLQPLLAGLFTYIFVDSLKRGKTASLISSVSFMFCGFMTVWMGYATLDYAILYVPLSLYAIERYYNSEKFRFLILLSLTFPLSFFSGHFQISFYFLLIAFGYIFYKFFTTRSPFLTFHVFLYTVFGILIILPQVLPSIEFYHLALRSQSFEKSEFIPWIYAPTFLVPDFFGNPVTGNNWFGDYAEWSAYIGVIPFMLAFYAVFRGKNIQTISIFGSAIVSILLAFNTPVLDLMVSLRIPVLSTSAASRIIVIFSFMFAVLAAFGYDYLFSDLKNNQFKKVFVWLTGFALIFISFWVLLFARKILPTDKLGIAKHNLIFPTVLFLLFSLVIVVGSLLNNYSAKRKEVFLWVGVLLLLLTVFDILRFATKWQAFDPESLVFADVSTTKAFSRISGLHRVMGNFGAEDAVYYHLPSVEGYDSLNNYRYSRFIASLLDGKIKEPSSSVVNFPKYGIYAPEAINLLDIRYFVHKIADGHFSWAFPFWKYRQGQFRLIYKDSEYEFYQNTKAFPHAFLVSNYKIITNPQKIVNTMFSKNFNLRNEVVLEKNIGNFSTVKNPGDTKITDYTANNINLSVSSRARSLLFLSEIFYPGWRAYVDNKETNIYRADYVFRAIVIPVGNHNIRFVYDPISFRIGVYIALAGIILMIATTARLRKSKKSF